MGAVLKYSPYTGHGGPLHTQSPDPCQLRKDSEGSVVRWELTKLGETPGRQTTCLSQVWDGGLLKASSG